MVGGGFEKTGSFCGGFGWIEMRFLQGGVRLALALRRIASGSS